MALSLKGYALFLLARRDYACYELRKKLLVRELNEAEIDTLLLELASLGYLSDQRFAVNLILNCALRKGEGPLKIRRILREKGVNCDLDSFPSLTHSDEVGLAGYTWVMICRELIEKKWRNKRHFTRNEKAALFRYLLNKGFRSSDIKEAFFLWKTACHVNAKIASSPV